MKSKLFIVLLIGIFLSLNFMSLVSAEQPWKQGETVNYTQYCTTGDCTYVNLTSITYPDGTVEIINEEMTKVGTNFYYELTVNDIGKYVFNTCGDPNGVFVCVDTIKQVTPSGNSGNEVIYLYIIIILLGYVLNLLGFFKKNTYITILGGIILLFTGLFMIKNGIIIFRENITLVIGYITLFWGLGSSLWAAIEEIQENM